MTSLAILTSTRAVLHAPGSRPFPAALEQRMAMWFMA